MRMLIGVALALLLLLALDFTMTGGKYFTSLSLLVDNVAILWGR